MTRYPEGARVRITDVLEGVVLAVGDGPQSISAGESSYTLDPELVLPFVRTVEVLELPRPEQPTEINAVVLARFIGWHAGVKRCVFIRQPDGQWAAGPGATWHPWVDLKDITVLHPGGVE